MFSSVPTLLSEQKFEAHLLPTDVSIVLFICKGSRIMTDYIFTGLLHLATHRSQPQILAERIQSSLKAFRDPIRRTTRTCQLLANSQAYRMTFTTRIDDHLLPNFWSEWSLFPPDKAVPAPTFCVTVSLLTNLCLLLSFRSCPWNLRQPVAC